MHLIYIISVHVVYCDTKQISEFLREDAFLGEGGTGYSDGNIPRSLGKATPMICFLEWAPSCSLPKLCRHIILSKAVWFQLEINPVEARLDLEYSLPKSITLPESWCFARNVRRPGVTIPWYVCALNITTEILLCDNYTKKIVIYNIKAAQKLLEENERSIKKLFLVFLLMWLHA